MVESFKVWSPDKYVYIRKAKTKYQRNWFLVKHDSGNNGHGGYLIIKNQKVYVPKELVGKRVRLFLEVIPDSNERVNSTE